jgi:hypothetical protein
MKFANQPAAVHHRHCSPTRGTRASVAAGSVLALIALLTFSDTSGARQATGHLAVGTTVKAYTQLKASNPTQLIVTNKDTNMGYANVPNPSNLVGSQLVVTTNDRAGYSLMFQVAPAMQSMFVSIEVSGLGTSVVLPATGGTVNLPYSGASNAFTLTYRFVLAKKVKDGTFAWPLAIAVHPN